MKTQRKILKLCADEYKNGSDESDMDNARALYGAIMIMMQHSEKDLRDILLKVDGFIQPEIEDKILKARVIIEKVK